MSFARTFLEGSQAAFHPRTLTPMQKLTLRFVIVGLVYYAFAVIEGMIMRIYAVEPLTELVPEEQYFGILTAHPLVGIFGSTYMLIFGAFLFLVPFLMKKRLWHFHMAQATFWLIAVGTFVFWFSGFLTHYAPLYTLYWPLPADTSQFNAVGGVFFIGGIAMIMVGTLLFVWNIFATILYTPKGEAYQHKWPLFRSAIGLTGVRNLFRKSPLEDLVPLPVAAVARGAVDAMLNSGVILISGVLILIYLLAELIGTSLKSTAVDALLYKNFFWWGLDLIADGLVLIWVAGAWYLLANLITGKPVFMQNVARAALLVELVVSWTVWSHHLLSDQAQPAMLKMVSGEFVTAFELITQGLAFFITLATLWTARPLTISPPLKFLLGGLTGFGLGVAAGILQADVGLNRILHNTQWVIGPHVHVAILVGLTMTIYSAVYLLLPILTNGAQLWSNRLTNVHFWCQLLGGIGMGAFMGMAGLQGMLRRTIYYEGEYEGFMILAALSGALIAIGLAAFLLNIVMTLGLKGAIGIFTRSPVDPGGLLPPPSEAPAPA
jgi:cytochrome c oxidase subunit 1